MIENLNVLGQLVDCIKDDVWVLDKELNFLYCNKNFEKYGWKVEELIGQNLSVIISEESMIKTIEAVMKYINDPISESSQTIIVDCKCKDSDEIVKQEVNATILRDCDNNVMGYCGVSRDITERDELLTENEDIKKVLEICGALCHEISQPFQILGGYIDILKLDKSNCIATVKTLDVMEKQINRVRDIVKKLQRVNSYKTKTYINGSRIFDIERSS